MPEFTHFDEDGATRMVDVGSKEATQRVATATATVRMQPETLGKITTESFAKGDVLEVARLAGIMATKQTGQLIPLCHPIGIDRVNVDFEILVPDRIVVRATVGVFAKTGVEMEAMTAVSVGLLTLYDMLKAVDPGMTIEAIPYESETFDFPLAAIQEALAARARAARGRSVGDVAPPDHIGLER